MRKHLIATITIGLVLLSFTLPAKPLPQAEKDREREINMEETRSILDAAITRLESGKKREALHLLSEVIMTIQSSQPLDVGKLRLCTEIRGFGDFDPREEFVLNAGDPLLLYMEPEGYGVQKKDDEYWISISQDAAIQNAQGETIFQRMEWIKYRKAFHSPVMPFYLTNRVSEIPQGTYTYSVTLKDHLKKTFITKRFQFKVQ